MYVPIDKSYKDNVDDINENLMSAFWKKGISLSKFWFDKTSIDKLETKSVNKIYNQGQSKYSLLVKFIKKDNYILAISTPIEHSQETIGIINKLNIIVGVVTVILISIVVFILSGKIIEPIYKLKILSQDISKLKFRTENIKTNDEIEDLADSINLMSKELEKAHRELNKKNESLKDFISDTSHEMKTPIALIKAYAVGMKDGLDDGTYTDTIIEQADEMSNAVNTLLYWAKYENKEINTEKFDLKMFLSEKIKKYELLIKESDTNLSVIVRGSNFFIRADKDGIGVVLDNLFTNAIKYTSDKKIVVEIREQRNQITFKIRNGISTSIKNLDDIWKPFYVIDKSRSKDLSGTGLGLSIVDEILKKHRFEHSVQLVKEDIEFYIVF
ncbi:sensor histidine kinase [Metaclostridioides mangenotii]|uniref:sensor histidine kinase n=1 Tax=Metaclostridioides mangenotii TaxID=1540 RepID=UPI000B20B1B9|nr:HAMP domain-containing sensor histidine kinase [Clostridioides mangenotii]